MKQYLFRQKRSLALSGACAVVAAGLMAGPAMAAPNPPTPPTPAAAASTATTVDTSACITPALTQALLSYGDSNYYTMIPGESTDMFTGEGWTLMGDAGIVSTTLADGATGTVLNLPSGSAAVSPTVCVNNGYQTARTEVRDVVGAEGVQFYVSYEGTPTWANPQNTGQVHGQQTNWTLSNSVSVQPGNSSSWELVRFVLIPGGKTSDFQIYNFWLDPRMCR